jgi:hypothetical protein
MSDLRAGLVEVRDGALRGAVFVYLMAALIAAPGFAGLADGGTRAGTGSSNATVSLLWQGALELMRFICVVAAAGLLAMLGYWVLRLVLEVLGYERPSEHVDWRGPGVALLFGGLVLASAIAVAIDALVLLVGSR